MKMKSSISIKLIRLIIITLSLLYHESYSQSAVHSVDDFLPGYKLVYGHEQTKIIDFEFLQQGLCLLSRTDSDVSKAKVILLDHENLIADSVIIFGWHSADFWSQDGEIYYRPSVLYENNFCEIDGRKSKKAVYLRFSISDDHFVNISCLAEENEQRKADNYELKEYSIEIVENRRNFQMKIFKSGKEVFEKETSDKKNPFLVFRIENGLVVLDNINQKFYTVRNDEKIRTFDFPTTFNLSEYRIQIKYDAVFDNYYVIKVPKERNEEYMTIFKYDLNRLNKIPKSLQKSYYNKIVGGQLYSILNIDRSDGNFNAIFSTSLL